MGAVLVNMKVKEEIFNKESQTLGVEWEQY